MHWMHLCQHWLAWSNSCIGNFVQDNFGALGWELPEEDYNTLSNFRQNRYFSGSLAMHEDGPWRNYEELWDEKDVSQPL